MTSNQERAEDVLNEWVDKFGGLIAIERDYGGDISGAAEALADAGLLATDKEMDD